MRIAQDRLTIETAPREIKEITREIGGWVAGQQIARVVDGLYPAYLGLAVDPGKLFARCAARSGGLSVPLGARGPRPLPAQ